MKPTVLAVCLFGVFAIAYRFLQPPVQLHGGAAWDGRVYATMAYQMCADKPLAVPAPYAFRIAMPSFVCEGVSWTNANFVAVFAALNLAFCLLAAILLAILLHGNGVSVRATAIVLVFYLCNYAAPMRLSFYYPTTTEPIFHCVLLAGLLLVRATLDGTVRPSILVLFSAMAVCVREAAIVIPFAYAVARAFSIPKSMSRENLPAALRAVAPLAASGGVFIVLHALIRPLPVPDMFTGRTYSSLDSSIHWFYTQSLARYVYSFVFVFGPALWMLVVSGATIRATFLARREWIGYCLAVLGLAYIGGTDTDRFLYWLFPVVFVLMGGFLDAARGKIPVALWAVTALVVAIQGRYFLRIPTEFQPTTPIEICTETYPCTGLSSSPAPILTFLTNNFQFHDAHPFWGTTHFIMTLFIQNALVVALLALWYKRATSALHDTPYPC